MAHLRAVKDLQFAYARLRIGGSQRDLPSASYPSREERRAGVSTHSRWGWIRYDDAPAVKHCPDVVDRSACRTGIRHDLTAADPHAKAACRESVVLLFGPTGRADLAAKG